MWNKNYQKDNIRKNNLLYQLFLEIIPKIQKEKYKEYQEKDMLQGITRFGVHHDDLIFKFDNLDLKEYGSEGQQKNSIIAYKLAEIEVFKNKINKLPILILEVPTGPALFWVFFSIFLALGFNTFLGFSENLRILSNKKNFQEWHVASDGIST